jgi:hypothetical protein
MKQIIATLLILLYLTCQSGMVVFAFDCSLDQHTHISLTEYVTCDDLHEHCNAGSHHHTCCENKLSACEHITDSDCGAYSNITLQLGSDALASAYNMHNIIANLQASFVPSILLSDYHHIADCYVCNYYTNLCKQLVDKYRRHAYSSAVVHYIHSITSIQDDDYIKC